MYCKLPLRGTFSECTSRYLQGVRATPSPLNPTPAEPRCTRALSSAFHRNVELTKSKALARYRHIGICLCDNVPRKSVANCTRHPCRDC